MNSINTIKTVTDLAKNSYDLFYQNGGYPKYLLLTDATPEEEQKILAPGYDGIQWNKLKDGIFWTADTHHAQVMNECIYRVLRHYRYLFSEIYGNRGREL